MGRRLACALCVVAVFCDRALGAPSASPTPAPYVNATCPTKLSEYRPFAKVFFDEGCVAAMEPRSDVHISPGRRSSSSSRATAQG